jgi:hypothetical protein
MKTMTNFGLKVLLSSLLIVGNLNAEEISLPIINKPSILEEGTQRELTLAQIAELLPWAHDSKLFLIDLLEGVQGLATNDKIDRLTSGIKQVVSDGHQLHSELFMRYILNRSLVLSKVLTSEMDMSQVGSQDAKVRVLNTSIKMAIKYYDIDMDILTKKSASPFKDFGVEYFLFLTELNKSIFDASAQYNIQRISLEWLQWDLYRDLNNAAYASQILKINNNLKIFPVNKLTDAQSITYIRQMKKVTLGMDFKSDMFKKGKTFSENSADVSNSITGSLKVGDRINYTKYSGEVFEIFNNGTVKVRFDGYSSFSTVKREDLGVAVKCFKQFCTDKIVNYKIYSGEIDEVFSNGKVKVMFYGYSAFSYVDASEVGTAIPKNNCTLKICKDSRIIFKGHPGVVDEVFDNNVLKIQYDGYSAFSYLNTSSLANDKDLGVAVLNIKTLKQDMRVNYKNYYGSAVELFDNNIVKIMFDGYSSYSYVSFDELGY